MYLKPALKLAIPFAIEDRRAMEHAYGNQGPEADEARNARRDLQELQSHLASNLDAQQRETARLALVWAEQYLHGLMDAVKHADKREYATARKQMRRLRSVRMEHFGKTMIETMCEHAQLVDVYEAVNRIRKMNRNEQ